MLKIIHLAHAGFLIENGKEKLIIDPAADSFGYEFKNEKVNYLLVSHDHWDHNNVSNIMVEPNTNSFIISKIDSFHDQKNGTLRGPNIIHIIESDGVRICHLGDLGHVLTVEQIKLIGNIDILIIPVGGVFTIDYNDAIKVVKQLNPDIVIPMHYKTDKWGADKGIDAVDKFIDSMQGYDVLTPGNKCFEYFKTNKKNICII